MAPWWNRQQMFYEQSLDCRDFHCEISIFTRLLFACGFGRTYFAEIISAKFLAPPPDRQGACKRKGLQQRQLLPARSTRSCRLFTACKAVSHGPFLCAKNKEPREHRHKSRESMLHLPLYQVRGILLIGEIGGLG